MINGYGLVFVKSVLWSYKNNLIIDEHINVNIDIDYIGIFLISI